MSAREMEVNVRLVLKNVFDQIIKKDITLYSQFFSDTVEA